NEAGNRAIQFDVVQVELAGPDFQRRFFVEIAHRLEIRMAKESIVVERKLGIYSLQRLLALGCQDDTERIDFYQRGVAFPPGLETAQNEFSRLADKIARQAQRNGDLSRLVRHHPHRRVNRFFEYLLWELSSNLLNIHPPLRAAHNHWARGGAVEQNGEVQLFL